MSVRNYQEIAVLSVNVQRGAERFSRYDETQKIPDLDAARVNVTGLSQVYNLFFIAGDSQVYVYQPRFPTQSLSAIASLIVKLPISRPGLQGYINPYRPHQVNHLVVDFLGNEEILLLSCDDGDVLAYRTREINAEIERRQEPE
ncbi:hypothetical protein LTS18_014889, partial [Coniosporium uncinatum]